MTSPTGGPATGRLLARAETVLVVDDAASSRQLIVKRPALKVIDMSGGEAIAQHGILQPGIAFLHQPFTSETLGRKIREVMDQ